MTEKKQGLKDVLNIRVDEALSREIERIAQVEGSRIHPYILRPAVDRLRRPLQALADPVA